MIIHKGYDNLILKSPVVTLGIFDGVHRGHRFILDRLVKTARIEKGESVVITFDPHPRLVLQKNHEGLSFLSTFREKEELLREAGIHHLIVIGFDKSFSNLSACDFVNKILHNKIGATHLIVGYDHHFGRKGEGNFKTVRECADPLNITAEQLPEYKFGGRVISSTSIREALLSGNIDAANNWLGYNYSLSGTIISGKRIGRSIGFPTANIQPDYEFKLIPADGVYAVRVEVEGSEFTGMLSIGRNPTVNEKPAGRTIEVHIIDFNKDIYNKEITVHFFRRLRSEMKFENIEQLAGQMLKDKEETLKLLR